MRLTNNQILSISITAAILLTANLLFFQNGTIGIVGILAYFAGLTMIIKKTAKKEIESLPLIFGFSTLLSFLIIALSITYYVYAINSAVSIIILWLPVIIAGWRLLNITARAPLPFAIKKIFAKENLWPAIILVAESALFFNVFVQRTSDLLKSPWQALDPEFFLLYTGATVAIITVNYFGKYNWIKYALTSIHLFLTYGIAAIIYPLGYGIDGFIHRAAENYILENGFITPKQPFYIGQYGLVVWLKHLTALPLFYLDVFLVPVLAAVTLPATIGATLEKTFGIAKKYGISLAFFVPFIFFINLNLTTPHNLGILFLIITLGAILTHISGYLPRSAPLGLAAATLAIHPLIGTPLLIFTILAILAKKFQSNKTAFAAI
ncbi:MAG: hypothetical protein AAB390_01885, partial [Patescibacteria group bacterium]